MRLFITVFMSSGLFFFVILRRLGGDNSVSASAIRQIHVRFMTDSWQIVRVWSGLPVIQSQACILVTWNSKVLYLLRTDYSEWRDPAKSCFLHIWSVTAHTCFPTLLANGMIPYKLVAAYFFLLNWSCTANCYQCCFVLIKYSDNVYNRIISDKPLCE